ncbi:MAG: GNAT family N-acetyltransferase [Vicinamibacterales bacterium]
MTTTPPSFAIVAAQPADVPLLLSLIRELAEYEQLGHEVQATPERLHNALFGADPVAHALIARTTDGTPAGFALYFFNFSTFLGKPGLYLEDLYVRPEYRKRGLGRRMLAHLAKLAVERDCGRMEWSVLNWNQMALRVYRAIGAQPLDEWTVQRLTGEGLARLAAQA